MNRWLAQDYVSLWNEAVDNALKKQSVAPTTVHDEEEKAAIRAELLARQGEYSRGMAALTADAMAPDDEDTLLKLQSKHPPRHPDSDIIDYTPPPTAPPIMDEPVVAKTIKSFHRGSSSGTMGLRPKHLQAVLLAHVDNTVKPLTALKNLVNHLLAGKAPLEVQPYFAGARLCALEKGENDVRPIAAGETIRRLVSKAACNAVRSKAREFFKGLQFGVATPAGSERIIHTCRHAMTIHTDNPDMVLCKVDLSNAFNNVSRATFLKLVGDHFPELFPWASWCYTTTSALTYRDHTLLSDEGVQQGDPLGPLFFSLVSLELAKEIYHQADLDLQLWYLDDGILIGRAEDVRNSLDTIARVGPRWGLYLNMSKCEIITPPASANVVTIFPDIPDAKINVCGNFSVLGSPIGSPEYCTEYLLTHAVEPAEMALDAITRIRDPQVAMALIRQCAGFCKLVHALRTTPPQSVMNLCKRLDDFLMHAVESTLCPLPPSARAQIQRLKRHGGFGLKSATVHASSAYASSVVFAAATDSWDASEVEGFLQSIEDVNSKVGISLLDSNGLVRSIPRHKCEELSPKARFTKRSREGETRHPFEPANPPSLPRDRALPHSEDFLHDTNPLYASEDCVDAEPPDWASNSVPRQKDISYAISATEFSHAYENADARTRARWASQCGKGASSWAFVTPSRDTGHAFNPTEFRILSRWWLGVPVYGEEGTCPKGNCTLPLDIHGDHALTCKHGDGIIGRHNALADHFADTCSNARLAPQREKSLGNRGPGGALTRPGDVFLPSLFLGKPIVLDFAVTHAQQSKYTDTVRNASWVAAGSFAEHYASEQKVRQRRESEDAGSDFTAIVVESYGSWSASALAVLRKVGERRAKASNGILTDEASTLRLVTDMNVTLMRCQARMMITRLPAVDPLPPLIEQ